MALLGETQSNKLWVGNLAPDVTNIDLVYLFQNYGPLDSVTVYSYRGFGFVYFENINDSKKAKDTLQGSLFHGIPLRIKFAKREEEPEFWKIRDRQYPNRSIGRSDSRLIPQDFVRNYFDPLYAGFTRQHPFQSQVVQRVGGQPTKVLCISYPPAVHVDEDVLHNAMILYGEIYNIKTFYDRNFSLVIFRSVEEAQCAKEGLQGKLFNDPRITIEYSSSDPAAPCRDFLEYHPSSIGPTTDSYPSENPFQPAQMGMFGHNHPMLASNVPGRLMPYGIHGPDIPARPLGMQGRFDPVISGTEFTDLPVPSKLRDTTPHNVMTSGEPSRSAIPGWNVFDSSQLQKETKRSRIDGAYDSSYPHKRTSERGPVLDERCGLGPFGSNVPSGPVAVSQENNNVSPVDARISPGQCHSGHDHKWRGVIAKGGIPVCHAYCVPIGESIDSKIPDVVNCSKKTGLDVLAKHYADAVGFNIVSFFPDTEKDRASYTEFLRYLTSNDRAWVAEFADGTTLFLVPPSDFLKKVLKIDGPTCIHGVVLKYAHHTPSGTSSQAARDLLTPELIAPLTNMLPSSSVEGTAVASAGMPASDVAVAQQSWRYE